MGDYKTKYSAGHALIIIACILIVSLRVYMTKKGGERL